LPPKYALAAQSQRKNTDWTLGCSYQVKFAGQKSFSFGRHFGTPSVALQGILICSILGDSAAMAYFA